MYWCNRCEHRFTPDDGFKGMRNKPKVIMAALDLYHKGLSSRKIADHLWQFYSVKVANTTVLDWIKKYAKLLKRYVDMLRPKVGGEVQADETFLRKKVRQKRYRGQPPDPGEGEEFYINWDAVDVETRYAWSRLSPSRSEESARTLYRDIKDHTLGVPQAITHDGWAAHTDAFNKYFLHESENIVATSLGEVACIERFHGAVKERCKVMRGFSRYESASLIMDGWTVYYNYIRHHMALRGSTPAEAAGINIKLGRNRWQTLILRNN
jgi:transposase-like protein